MPSRTLVISNLVHINIRIIPSVSLKVIFCFSIMLQQNCILQRAVLILQTSVVATKHLYGFVENNKKKNMIWFYRAFPTKSRLGLNLVLILFQIWTQQTNQVTNTMYPADILYKQLNTPKNLSPFYNQCVKIPSIIKVKVLHPLCNWQLSLKDTHFLW